MGVAQPILVLEQRLSDPGEVAVTEDPERAVEERSDLAVGLDVLLHQEANRRLRGGEPLQSSRRAMLPR